MSTPDDKETAPKEDNPTKEEESVNAVDILEYPGVSSDQFGGRLSKEEFAEFMKSYLA